MIKIILVSLLVLISSCSKKSGKKGSMRNSPNQAQAILIKIDDVVSNSNSILIYTNEILDLDTVEFYTDDKCLNHTNCKN